MEGKLSLMDTVKKWAPIYGLVGLIIALLSAILDVQSMGIVSSIVSSLLNWGIAFGIYFLATKEFRTDNEDFLSFGEGFKIVALVGLIGGVIRAIGFYIYIKAIDPYYMERMIAAQIEAQENAGVAYDPDAVPGFMNFLQTPEFLALATIFSAIVGFLILGLIAVAINKKTEDF
ncbi:MAG: hypothetical protein ACI8YP_003673 [Algoriphagus sp.]|jgi:hypothetical protein